MENKKAPLTIVKIGGNVIDDEIALAKFLHDFSSIPSPKILVHGGGKEASRMAEKLGFIPEMIDGRRITDQNMLNVVVMTYAGLLNKKIVAQLNVFQTNAIGLSGADGNSIVSKKRQKTPVDFGFVGDVIKVNTTFLRQLMDLKMTPVFCAITQDENGQLLNTNADTVASEIAISLSEFYAIKLIYCFEKQGVLLDIEDNDSVIEILNPAFYKELLKKKAIHSGMIPKLDNCFEALSKGVEDIIICHHSAIRNEQFAHTTIRL